MTYTYQITLRNQFHNASGILIFLIGFTLAPYYLLYHHGEEYLTSYYLVCFGSFLLYFIPQLIIHMRYYRHDKKRVFYYTPDEQRLGLQLDSGQFLEFTYDDIEYIERNKSRPLAEKRMLWLPWDKYNYSVIHLKSGDIILVTSLLVPGMDLPIESSKIKLRKRFYTYPFGVTEKLTERLNDEVI